jgi:hypothetical protein
LFFAASVLHSHLLAPHGNGLGGDPTHGREGHLLPGKQCFATTKKYFLCLKVTFVLTDNLTVCRLCPQIELLSQMSKEDHVTRKRIFHQFALKFKQSFWT